MESIRDEAFGELTFDDSWVREVELTFLGVTANVELIVEGNDEYESIFDEQRASYQQLPNVVPMAEDALFEFYQHSCDDYRSRFGDEADRRMPRISEKSELSNLVKLTGVLFPMVTNSVEISIGFLLECSWEPEHGIGIKVMNTTFQVGTQDILT